MSKGAVDAGEAIAAGARPSGIVFVSGMHAVCDPNWNRSMAD